MVESPKTKLGQYLFRRWAYNYILIYKYIDNRNAGSKHINLYHKTTSDMVTNIQSNKGSGYT